MPSAFATLALLAGWLGGYSRKVARNDLTMSDAGANTQPLSAIHSMYSMDSVENRSNGSSLKLMTKGMFGVTRLPLKKISLKISECQFPIVVTQRI